MKVLFQYEVNGVKENITSVKQLREEIRRTNKAFLAVDAADKEYDQLKKTLGELRAINKGVTQDVKRQERQFEQTTKFAKGSYRALNAQLVTLRDQFKNLGAAERNAKLGKSLIRDIQRLDKELKDLDGNIGLFQRNVGNYGKAFSGLGKLLVGGALIGGVVALTKAVAAGTRQMFELSTQTDALAGKNLTVLGDGFAAVSESANMLAADMGLTTNEFISATAATADILKPLGFQATEAAELGVQVTSLSGALSEWTGGQKSAEESANALQAALVGEREQLKQYGIVLQESDIQARLAAKGQDNYTGAALKQAKAIASLELIQESSTDAQTAFAENSDTLIRVQGRLVALFNESRDALATNLIPVFGQILRVIEPFLRVLVQNVPLAIAFLRETFTPLFQAVGNLVSTLQSASNSSNSFAQTIRRFAVGTIRVFANVLTGIVELVTNLVGAFSNARNEAGEFNNDVGLLTRLFVGFIEALGFIPAVVNGIINVFRNGGEVIRTFFKDIALSAKIAFLDLQGVMNTSAKAQAAILRAQRDGFRRTSLSAVEAFQIGFAEAIEDTNIQVPEPDPEALRKTYGGFGKQAADSFIDTADQEAESKTPFQRLIDRQKALQDSIRNLRVEGKGYTKQLEEYLEVTKQINEVNEIFNNKTEKQKKVVEGAQGSLNILNEQIRVLTESLGKADPDDVGAIAAELAKAQRELKAAQEAINAILDPEKALAERLRKEEDIRLKAIELERQQRIKALNERQLTEEEYAFERSQIELDAERQAALARAEVYKDEIATRLQNENEAAAKQKEIEAGKTEFLREELERRAELVNTILGGLQSAIDIIATVQETRTNNELAAVEEKYAREIELAEGNEERQEELQNELEAERQRIETEAFERQKKIQAATATVSYLQGVVNILSSPSTIPDPFGRIFKGVQIGFLTGSYLANLARIKSQRVAEKGTLIERGEMSSIFTMMERGGMLPRALQMGAIQGGRSHTEGGNHAVVYGQPLEYERGEFADFDEFGNFVMVNKQSTRRFLPELKSMAGNSFPGKGQVLSGMNSYLGAGLSFARDGIIIPNTISGASGGSASVSASVNFTEEQMEQFAIVVGARVESGSAKGVSDSSNEANREAERQQRLTDGTTI